MKACEVCGTTKGYICGKHGKYGMDLCGKHYMQMSSHGKILDKTISKRCEICGSEDGKIYGKSGEYKMDLCGKHYAQIYSYGKVLHRTKRDPNEIIIYDGYAEIQCFDHQGIFVGSVKIDAEDIPVIREYKWNAGNKVSPVSTTHLGKCIPLPRLLMKTKKNERVTYKNKDTWDCRKNNLIVGTISNALQNCRISTKNTSGHKGVSWDSHALKWRPTITVNRKCIHLGSFDNISDAIAVRRQAEAKYFGDFAYDESRDVTLKQYNSL